VSKRSYSAIGSTANAGLPLLVMIWALICTHLHASQSLTPGYTTLYPAPRKWRGSYRNASARTAILAVVSSRPDTALDSRQFSPAL
jgi:hypothetical protein